MTYTRHIGYRPGFRNLLRHKVMTPAKTRQPRLRASCDGCFLAKVKCSKARPMCNRCLSCGISCNYSPSSRVGKPKPEISQNPVVSALHSTQPMQAFTVDHTMSYSSQTTSSNQLFPIENWEMPSPSVDGSMRHLSVSSDMPQLGFSPQEMAQLDASLTAAQAQSGFYPTPNTWQPTTSVAPTVFPDASSPAAQMSFMQTQSFNYVDQRSPDTMYPPGAQPQPSPTTNLSYLPSPQNTPIQPTMYPPHPQNGRRCNCFGVCMKSLMYLHNVSYNHSLPFGNFLGAHDRAVDGGSALMACTTCFEQFGGDNSVMFLATMFNKIATAYRDGIRTYCGIDTLRGVQGGPPPPGTMGPGGTCSTASSEQQTLGHMDRAVRKLEGHYTVLRNIPAPNMKSAIDEIGATINACYALIEFVRANNEAVIFGMVAWDGEMKEKEETQTS